MQVNIFNFGTIRVDLHLLVCAAFDQWTRLRNPWFGDPFGPVSEASCSPSTSIAVRIWNPLWLSNAPPTVATLRGRLAGVSRKNRPITWFLHTSICRSRSFATYPAVRRVQESAIRKLLLLFPFFSYFLLFLILPLLRLPLLLNFTVEINVEEHQRPARFQ
jgi:hypothetical protein